MSPNACIAPKAFGISAESGRDSGGTANFSIEGFRIDGESIRIGHFARIVDKQPRLLHRVGCKQLQVLLLTPESGKQTRLAAIPANLGEPIDKASSRLL